MYNSWTWAGPNVQGELDVRQSRVYVNGKNKTMAWRLIFVRSMAIRREILLFVSDRETGKCPLIPFRWGQKCSPCFLKCVVACLAMLLHQTPLCFPIFVFHKIFRKRSNTQQLYQDSVEIRRFFQLKPAHSQTLERGIYTKLLIPA